MKCVRCGRFIHDGDTGWYYQVPMAQAMGNGVTLTFMDRVDICDDGLPHEPEETRPSITCWKCGRISYHPRDIAEGYCAACCGFTKGKVER